VNAIERFVSRARPVVGESFSLERFEKALKDAKYARIEIKRGGAVTYELQMQFELTFTLEDTALSRDFWEALMGEFNVAMDEIAWPLRSVDSKGLVVDPTAAMRKRQAVGLITAHLMLNPEKFFGHGPVQMVFEHSVIPALATYGQDTYLHAMSVTHRRAQDTLTRRYLHSSFQRDTLVTEKYSMLIPAD